MLKILQLVDWDPMLCVCGGGGGGGGGYYTPNYFMLGTLLWIVSHLREPGEGGGVGMVKITVIVTSCYKKGTETLKTEEDRT